MARRAHCFPNQIDGVLLSAREPDLSCVAVGLDSHAAHSTVVTPADTPGPFNTERLGGVAVAKNVPLASDCSHVAVVMNRGLLTTVGDYAAQTIFLIAHELFHPVLDRLRHQSGVLDGVI